MASSTKQTRENQKKHFEQLLSARKAVLLKRGLDEKTLARDSHYRHLQAKYESITGALAAIEFRKTQNESIKNMVKVEKPKPDKHAAEKAKAERPQKPPKEKPAKPPKQQEAPKPE